jgi:uncharacterized membrane protein YedE/YeeE
MSILFLIFLIVVGLCILLSVLLLLLSRVRWARRAALVPLGFGLLSAVIGIIGHFSQFPAWRLIVVLIFAAAITALICLFTALLLLGLGPKPPQPEA